MEDDLSKHQIPIVPQQVGSLEPETFGRAVEQAFEIAVRLDPSDDPILPLPLYRRDGSIDPAVLVCRVGLGLFAFYGDHHTHGWWAWHRFTALQACASDPRAAAWVSAGPGEGLFTLQGALLAAAAGTPLNDDWKFEPDLFFESVAELAAAGA